MRFVDVVVVGGGPAGSTAAAMLARAGREVVLIDRARFPRDKCCGDGLTTAAVRSLEALGLCPKLVPSWNTVDACSVRSPSGRTVTFPFPRDGSVYAAVAPRMELDQALLDLARAAGVKVLDGHGLTAASAASGGIVVQAEGLEPIAARYAVGADGMWSPLRKALGAAEVTYLGEWHAFRQYFTTTEPLARRMWVWFEPDLLPGYAWSFPLRSGRVNVGFGVPRRPDQPAGPLGAQWRALLARPHVRAVLGSDARPAQGHRAWPIPARLAAAPPYAVDGRALFVGDAARACDPMTGEGIAQGLETGRLAAEAVLAAGPHRPDAATRHYAAALHGMIVDHRMADRLSSLLAHRKGARAAVRAAGLSAWTRVNFGRWLFEDYPRAVLLTPRRWHRQMLAGHGAFGSRPS